jgi:hypothetical protein
MTQDARIPGNALNVYTNAIIRFVVFWKNASLNTKPSAGDKGQPIFENSWKSIDCDIIDDKFFDFHDIKNPP